MIRTMVPCHASIYPWEPKFALEKHSRGTESLAHGRRTALASIGLLGLGLGDALGEDSGVLVL